MSRSSTDWRRCLSAYYRFFGALPSFGDPAHVQRTLAFAISPAVRTQDTATLVAGLHGAARIPRRFMQVRPMAEWPTLTQTLGHLSDHSPYHPRARQFLFER